MYFRDARNLTAKQRQTLDRFMARDCDETGKKLNYTASNGERPSISTPATNVHVHLHDDLENGPPRPPAVPSTTSGREPGLPNNDPLDDVQEQLAALNVAVATLATAGGYDPGDDGQVPEDDNGDDTNNSSFTNDPTDGPDITSQIASQHVNSTDELPDIADINEKNKKFWAGSTSQSVTGGGDIAINSQGTPGKTDNGIDVNRRLSTGTKRLDAGRTSANNLKAFGTTNDAVMAKVIRIEDRAMVNKNLMRRTNKQISRMQTAKERMR